MLCFAVKQISPLPNYHECFRTYFARSTILHVALFTERTSRRFCRNITCFCHWVQKNAKRYGIAIPISWGSYSRTHTHDMDNKSHW